MPQQEKKRTHKALPVYRINKHITYMRTAISVIIPMYNATGFIGKCLHSVFNQTFTNFEIILIDDCSTDNSIDIAKNLISTAPSHLRERITLLKNDKNSGQSFSRNRGIDAAVGEWLYFMDSDDEITNDCFETLIAKVEEGVEMVIGNYKMIGYQKIDPFSIEEGIYYPDKIIPQQLHWQIYTMPWNKLISKEFIKKHNLYFRPGLIHEDNLWSFCSAFCFNKISVSQKKTYIYYIREGSTERSNTKEFHEENLFNVQLYMLEFLYTNKTINKKACRKHHRAIYKFVEKEIRNFILQPLYREDQEKSFDRYKAVRNTNHWSFKNLLTIFLWNKHPLRALHCLLSHERGHKLYIKKF